MIHTGVIHTGEVTLFTATPPWGESRETRNETQHTLTLWRAPSLVNFVYTPFRYIQCLVVVGVGLTTSGFGDMWPVSTEEWMACAVFNVANVRGN